MTTTAIKERPILFSAPMVLALRDHKTQTRRLRGLERVNARADDWSEPVFDPTDQRWVFTAEHGEGEQLRLKCPYGVWGDRLWVRETFWNGVKAMQLPCGEYESYYTNYIEYAEQRDSEGWRDGDQYKDWMVKRPSIHMPRWASRITLEVVRVRVERLQHITHEDCLAEGIREVTKDGVVKKYCVYDLGRDMSVIPWRDMPRSARECMAQLWNSINAKRGYAWVANPWVWVVEFEMVEQSHHVGSDAGRSEQ